MVVNRHAELLFIDYDLQYMKTVKEILENGKRLPEERIHLVHNILDGERILRERDTIEQIVLHAEADKPAIRKALTRLRRLSLAEIMVISTVEDQDDISEIYRFGMSIMIPPIYKPEMAVAYFEAFIERHRLLPSISSMREVEHIKDDAKMQCGDLTIDPASFTVEREGQKIDLTTQEFKLLHFLARNEGVVFTQEKLFEHVWAAASPFHSDLTSRIARLRAKIEPDRKHPTYIRTKRGAGYYFTSK